MPAASVDDRFAINNLFVRYTTALDACDVETVVECFEPDGSLESPVFGRFAGSDGIREFAMRTVRLKQERGVQFRHAISNLRVEVEGTRAQEWCYLLDFMTHDGATELLSPGEYICELKKTDGAWRFDRRSVTMDRSFTLPGGARNIQNMKNAPSQKPLEERRAEDTGTRRIE